MSHCSRGATSCARNRAVVARHESLLISHLPTGSAVKHMSTHDKGRQGHRSFNLCTGGTYYGG